MSFCHCWLDENRVDSHLSLLILEIHRFSIAFIIFSGLNPIKSPRFGEILMKSISQTIPNDLRLQLRPAMWPPSRNTNINATKAAARPTVRTRTGPWPTSSARWRRMWRMWRMAMGNNCGKHMGKMMGNIWQDGGNHERICGDHVKIVQDYKKLHGVMGKTCGKQSRKWGNQGRTW